MDYFRQYYIFFDFFLSINNLYYYTPYNLKTENLYSYLLDDIRKYIKLNKKKLIKKNMKKKYIILIKLIIEMKNIN